MKQLIYFYVVILLCGIVTVGCSNRRSETVVSDSTVVELEPVVEINDSVLELFQTVRPINSIVIHCSASGDDYDMPLDSIRKDHLSKGWLDVGYHYYITRDGVVHKARPLNKRGAHVRGHNEYSIGICYEGGLRRASDVPGMESITVPEEIKDKRYDIFKVYLDSDTIIATAIRGEAYVAYDTRTKAQKKALAELVSHLLVLYPNAKVSGHRDFSRDLNHDGVISPNEWIKSCPSFEVKDEF